MGFESEADSSWVDAQGLKSTVALDPVSTSVSTSFG